MQFEVRLIPVGDQQVRQVLVEAATEAELRARMGADGTVVLRIRPVKASAQVGRVDVAAWCREMRTLVQAGMTVVEAVEAMRDQNASPNHRNMLTALRRSLQEGQSLSRAMRGTGAFPQVLLAGVTASERTSTLAAALDDYLRYDTLIMQLRRQAVSAAIYPSIVVALGILIAAFLLLYVVPRFSGMYVDFQGSLSFATRVLVTSSKVLRDHSAWFGVGLVGAISALAWAWRNGWLETAGQAILDGIEPLQRQIDHFRLAKLYHSLALMFRGGYTLQEALEVCEDLGIGPRLERGLKSVRSSLWRGSAVAPAFADAGLADPVTQRLLAVGERTGDFAAVLQTIADRHADAFSTFVERATRVVEPLLLLLVALMVGGIVVMMYMPIFDMASGLQ